MFRKLYPAPFRGAPFKAHDTDDRQGIKGDESRKSKCVHCGFVCDPDRDTLMKDGDYAGKGIDYGGQHTTTITYANGKTETNYYYDVDIAGGCPFCGSYIWR